MLEHGVQGFLHEPRDVATLTQQLDLLSSDADDCSSACAPTRSGTPTDLTWAAATDDLVAAYRRAGALVKGAAHARSE